MAVIKIAASSDSVEEDITNLMISAMVRMGPFKRGMVFSLERKICAGAAAGARLIEVSCIGVAG